MMTPRTAKPDEQATLLRQSITHDVWLMPNGDMLMRPVAPSAEAAPDLVGMFEDNFAERRALTDAIRSAPALQSLYPVEPHPDADAIEWDRHWKARGFTS